MIGFIYMKLCCGCSSISDAELDRELSGVSMLLNENCESMVDETTVLKNVFTDAEVEKQKPVPNHTHGESAAARSTASLLIDRIGSSSGLPVVFYQGSAADARRGRQMGRSHLWAKDQNATPQHFEPSSDAIVAMVDVDYYVDMPKMLAKDFRPYLLYTCQPSNVCKDEGEYKYTFLKDGRILYRVSGGGEYLHHLWNYDGDSFAVEQRRFFGLLPGTYATYAIERRQMDADHQLILVAPLSRVSKPWLVWLAKLCHQAKKLERLNPVDGDFLRMEVNDVERLMVCTGKVGGYSQSKTAARVDTTIKSALITMSGKPTLASVKSKMENNKHDVNFDFSGAETLLEYHLRGGREGARVTTLESSVRRYQYVSEGKAVDEDAKPGMVAFMKPLLDGGFVPDKCVGNDERAVVERVEKLKDNTISVTNFTSQCMDEFLELFMPHVGCLEPFENDEVYRRQARPAQKRILDAAQNESATRVAKDFVKNEAYPSVNDPRLIAQINGVDKMAYSAYVYAMSDYIKSKPWYAFGKSPKEIAERVTQICERAEFVAMTDFSRMDGRVGIVAREFERRMMMRAFKKDRRVVLYGLMRKQFCLNGVTRFGVKFKTEWSRCSGSPETSDFNTSLNAFVNFMAFRRQRDERGNYLTPAQAYLNLGLYGGDDGITAGLTSKAATAAASSVGQKLELQRVGRGQPGVTFLARRYGPDVWFGDSNSCCDIKRQLAKFHLTVHLPSNISKEEKLRDKAFSFQLSDGNTPLIGEFVRKVHTLFPMAKDEYKNLSGRWNVNLDSSSQYPNEVADWMSDVVTADLPKFDIEMYRAWLGSVNGVTIFEAPQFCEPPKINAKAGKVVVDGDIHVVAPEVKIPVVIPERTSRTGTHSKRAPPNVKQEGKKKHFRAKKPKSERASQTLKQEK